MENFSLLVELLANLATVLGGGPSASRARQLRACLDFAGSKGLSAGALGTFAGVLDRTPVTLRAPAQGPVGAKASAGARLCFGLTPALPRALVLTRASFAGRLTALLAARREKASRFEPLTDAQLDAAFALPASAASALRDRRVRLALLEAIAGCPRLSVGNGVLELRTEARGALPGVELERMLHLGLLVASAFRDAAGAMPEVEALQVGGGGCA